MSHSYSVIIPFHGKLNILEDVVRSLENTQYVDKEVIIVNDGTNYNFSAILKKYQITLLHLSHRHGPSVARNKGAQIAKYEHLVFLDSDVIVPENCFFKINDILENNQSIPVINGLISSHCPYGNFFSQYGNMLFRYSILKDWANTVFTSFCVISSSLFQAVGGFDERIPLQYADDVALGWKLYDKGCKFGLSDGLEFTHCKKMGMANFIVWRFLHGFFYGKFYSAYRNRSTCKARASITALAGIFLAMNIRFANLLVKEKGLIFMIMSMPVTLFQYTIYSAGAVSGMLSGFGFKDKTAIV